MIRKGIFLKSAVHPQDYLQSHKPEIAIAGRSNAGKSSLINVLTGSKIAKVSQVPGKTRLLNFFAIGEEYILVDMPGYGYASRSGDEVLDWGDMIQGYLQSREQLKGLLLLMDIRREWDDDERMLKRFCNEYSIPLAIILTKTDKVGKQQATKALQSMKKKAATELVFLVSNVKKDGIFEMEEKIYREWIRK